MTGARPIHSARAAPWPAMLLTAGLGTRLAPLSDLRAKPALPVAGVPLAGRILQWLARAGVRDAVLNLHHRPESVTAAIGDGAAFGVRVRYSWEQTILGSAGGPARALPMLDAERFFLVNGDTLTDLDLEALAVDHAASGAAVTLAVTANPNPLHYGGVSVGEGGRVTGFTAAGPGNRGWHFIGVQAVDRSVFASLDPNRAAETIRGVYRELIAGQPGSVRAMVSTAAFFDIGTAADYLDTCLAVAGSEGLGTVLVGARTAVSADARVTRSVLWDDVTVAGGAVLDECVVADGVDVPANVSLARRILTRSADRTPRAGDERLGGLLVSPLDARRRAS